MARKKKKDAVENKAHQNVKSALADIETEASIFLTDETESEGFLPEPNEAEQAETEMLAAEEELPAEQVTKEADVEEFEASESNTEQETENGNEAEIEEGLFAGAESTDSETQASESEVALEGTELDGFESADIEEVEFVEEEQLHSIIESILFASDRPVSLASIQLVFKGTNVKKDKIRRVLDTLSVEYASGRRGVVLEEVTGGYQLRTKVDNMNFLKRTIKTKAFKLSGPALETLSIVAYKQPVVKVEIDQIRGVESGHLLRALMEKGLVNFEGKAETLPGKPMQYGTTRRFLEIFGLRNLKELPTLSQIDELLPEGIGDETEEKETLSMVTDSMAEQHKATSYSEGEEELGQIEDQLTAISTSSEFFEQEKMRQKMKRDEEKAQNIREALAVGETVSKRDINWLKKFENPEPSPPPAGAQAEGATSDDMTSELATPEDGEELALADQAVGSDEVENDQADEDRATFEEEDADLSSEDELPFYEEADDDGTPEEGHA